jgi:hypothetical protein
MNKKDKLRVASIVMAVIAVFMLMPERADSWDPATHAFIEEHLYKEQGQLDAGLLNNRIYGANAMDLFNNKFSSPYIEFAAYMHDTTQENFLKAWEIAVTRTEKAFAYGFVGHNNSWGMDSTAHISGITFGRGQGYVIAKAQMLAAVLKPVLEAQLGQSLSDEVVVNICHYLVESGVDFLVRGIDPTIGNKLMVAALNRSPEVPVLLIKAYKADLAAIAGISEAAAALEIATAEGTEQSSIYIYGFALTQDNALELVAGGLAKVGAEYLGLPPGSDAALVPVVEQGIIAAMTICAPDFERELRASTGWVNGRLSSHGIAW